MRWLSFGLLWAGAVASAADSPKPAPVVVPPPSPPAEFQLAPQPVYGPLRPIVPAHRLALLEERRPIEASDPGVARFADLLEKLTARYVEDAPRIEELTTAVCQAIRASNKPAAPSEILEGALAWKRPADTRADVPRRFSDFARRYRALRVKEGKDHKAALSALQPTAAPSRDR